MIKLALIGCGKWGKNYLKTVTSIAGCELKWACDLDYQKLNQAALLTLRQGPLKTKQIY